MFPASTNDQYRGAAASAWFLALLAVGSIVPGCIHYFLPDGGAEVIAGLDLGASRSLVIGVFAWMGATQIAYGLAQLAIALRYRPLVPLFLLLALTERTLAAIAGWITKAAGAAHHPPEHYAVVVLAPIILIFLVLSLRRT
ncbi:hypothetical protein [Candidatus Viadribacter manganicus]|uniref:DUF4345 domain-containing protein n=1 Tax=Candidatus Viadribacter manganicus TaxID=1759059 RepID=A0A1B1AFB2_9PROT|nr:hypothetical protein [Candidatus Viadribacter manganicus]ANP45234.1 hypothetical protein ATE48_04520 [Candidatus Viadribacter manganicus]